MIPALQLFKNSINTQEKLRLNLHSLSVSVSELLEYGRYTFDKKRHKNLSIHVCTQYASMLTYSVGRL